jgi:hypothetical protein
VFVFSVYHAHFVREFLQPSYRLADRRKLLGTGSVVFDAGWSWDWKVNDKNIPKVSNWYDWDESVRDFAAALVNRNILAQ